MAVSRTEVRKRDKFETATTPKVSTSAPSDLPKVCKTIGRTSDGIVFEVPHTSDMVSTIFDPREAKTEWDIIIIAIILIHGALFWKTSGILRRTLFLVLFAFWRMSYNLGIGYVLYQQSNHKLLVKYAKRYNLFDVKQSPLLGSFIRRQISNKMGKDFDFEKSPPEFLTWLLFRRGVDLVLMLDFCSYVLLAFSWAYVPTSHNILQHCLRWLIGWSLILFNLWVKLDANRVVGPVGAWHWADFFYLTEADLTFDGVYELCMHPMYSLGYIGYYGISLLACSYAVLFTSILAHMSQFAFLYVVEEPHIDKTYNPKNPVQVQANGTKAKELMSTERAFETSAEKNATGEVEYTNIETKFRGQIFRPFDPFRATDLTQMLTILCGAICVILVPRTSKLQSFIVMQAFLWRFVHSLGLLYSLKGQSQSKLWTKHFLKFGDSPKRAWQEWKSIYAISLTILHTTFVVAFMKSYTIPADWQYGTVTLRHVLGIALILMHIWTSISVYEVLGDFGWYFGDFFVDEKIPKLKYTGVYRYLNNPERIVYSCWGFALMSNSNAILALAIQAQLANLFFITCIEKPHMRKLYGDQVRKVAGFTRSLKSMPVVDHPQIKKKVESIEVSLDRAVEVAVNAVSEYVQTVRPHLDRAVEDTKIQISRYQNFVTITRAVDHLDIDPSTYSMSTEKTSSNIYDLGEPIRVRWHAPPEHSKKDWIGIYRITDNTSTLVTRVSSKSRWSAIHAEGFEDHNGDIIEDNGTQGLVEFRGNTLPWTVGTYELRYHHDGKHNVMSISEPLEIYVEPSSETNYYKVEQDLLRLVGQILSSEKGTSVPQFPEDKILFGDMAEVCANRIAYGISKRYGIDFAWQLLANDASIRNYTARIAKSRKILAPFVTFETGSS